MIPKRTFLFEQYDRAGTIQKMKKGSANDATAHNSNIVNLSH